MNRTKGSTRLVSVSLAVETMAMVSPRISRGMDCECTKGMNPIKRKSSARIFFIIGNFSAKIQKELKKMYLCIS